MMFQVVLLSVPFFIVPVLLGHIQHVRSNSGKSVWYYRRYLMAKDWMKPRYTVVMFGLSGGTLMGALLFSTFCSSIEPGTGILLGILTIITGLWHLYRYFGKAIGLVRNHVPLPWKTLLGLTALGIATLSKILVDQMITDTTQMPARDLPSAQLILALYLTPTLWFSIFSLTLGLAAIVLALPFQLYLFWSDYRSVKAKPHHDSWSGLAALIALVQVPALSIVLTQKLISEKTYSVPVRKAIAFAAFQLPPAYCGLSDIKGATVTPLQEGVGAIAMPDKKLGYRFERIICQPVSKNAEQINKLANNDEIDALK